MHARVVIYKTKPGTAEAAIKKAEQGLLPIFRGHKGFHSYEVIHAGHDTVVSLSTWESEGEALAAVKAGAAWVQGNIADSIISAETHVGVVSFSHRASRPA
jgi:heme-degrading monooxygenase HmoA